MRPRKSASEWSNEGSYPAVLQKLCQEEDVLIIPQFVAYYLGRQAEYISPRKSKTLDKSVSSFQFQSESLKEDSSLCIDFRPPQVGIFYETPDDRDNPVGVICKNIYIEFALIHAIGKSLRSFPTINILKIENCCISKEIAEALALVLAEEPGRRIYDLSLDGNEGISSILPLYISFPTGLRCLSLQKCSLDDDDIKLLAKPLGFLDEKDHKLQILNLGMNKIGDLGLSYIAEALRTNRSLISLSLAGNQIGDKGVLNLVEVLMKFKLTYEEVVLRRRRIFNQIFKKKNILEKYLEEWKMKGEVESLTSKKSSKSGDRHGATIKKIRGPDGKLRCLSSRDKRGKSSQVKMNSGEKFRGRIRSGMEENPNGIEPTPSELLAIAQQVDSEMTPDKHPFVNEVMLYDDGFYCSGCWSLGNINLAYNYVTEKSIESFTKVFISQNENFRFPKIGLIRLVLQVRKIGNKEERENDVTIFEKKLGETSDGFNFALSSKALDVIMETKGSQMKEMVVPDKSEGDKNQIKKKESICKKIQKKEKPETDVNNWREHWTQKREPLKMVTFRLFIP